METEQLERTKLTRGTAQFRARVLLTLGWLLFTFSIVLLAVQVLWMWPRMGRGAPLIAVGLAMDAAVGMVLIVMGTRARARSRQD